MSADASSLPQSFRVQTTDIQTAFKHVTPFPTPYQMADTGCVFRRGHAVCVCVCHLGTSCQCNQSKEWFQEYE